MKRTQHSQAAPQHALDLRATVAFRLLGIASRLTHGFITTYTARFGIGLPEWRTLGMLGQFGPLPAIRIAELAEMDRGAISRAVASLERRRVIKRAADPTHGRREVIALTRAGERLHAEVSKFARARNERLEALLSPAELAMLDQLLAKLAEWAQELQVQANGMRPTRVGTRRGKQTRAPVPARSFADESRERLLSELVRFKRVIATAL